MSIIPPWELVKVGPLTKELLLEFGPKSYHVVPLLEYEGVNPASKLKTNPFVTIPS
jgi:hypothetical protein